MQSHDCSSPLQITAVCPVTDQPNQDSQACEFVEYPTLVSCLVSGVRSVDLLGQKDFDSLTDLLTNSFSDRGVQ